MIHVYQCTDARTFILTEKPHSRTLVKQVSYGNVI